MDHKKAKQKWKAFESSLRTACLGGQEKVNAHSENPTSVSKSSHGGESTGSQESVAVSSDTAASLSLSQSDSQSRSIPDNQEYDETYIKKIKEQLVSSMGSMLERIDGVHEAVDLAEEWNANVVAVAVGNAKHFVEITMDTLVLDLQEIYEQQQVIWRHLRGRALPVLDDDTIVRNKRKRDVPTWSETMSTGNDLLESLPSFYHGPDGLKDDSLADVASLVVSPSQVKIELSVYIQNLASKLNELLEFLEWHVDIQLERLFMVAAAGRLLMVRLGNIAEMILHLVSRTEKATGRAGLSKWWSHFQRDENTLPKDIDALAEFALQYNPFADVYDRSPHKEAPASLPQKYINAQESDDSHVADILRLEDAVTDEYRAAEKKVGSCKDDFDVCLDSSASTIWGATLDLDILEALLLTVKWRMDAIEQLLEQRNNL